MKKTFSLKKKLPKVLAVALAAACFAGAVPANAAGVTRAYSTIGSYGSFEEYMWRLSDNTSGDILSFNAENQPVVTKGTGATGTEGTSLASRRIALAAGNYQLSFTVKASTQGYYIAGGYGFDSAGNPKEIKYTNTHEGIIGTEWTSVTTEFTVPEGYTSNEFRLFLRGNSGDRITVKDLDVKKIEERVKSRDVATLDGWNNTNNGYSDPNETYANISLSDDGVTEENPGSVHIYTNYSVNCAADKAKTAAIGYNLTNLTVDNTYVFEAYIKGNTKVGVADPLTAELRFSRGKWTENNEATIRFSETNLVNSTEWKKVSFKFIPSETSVAIGIGASRYQGVDCYIDNIKVYPEGRPETNLISNSTFCETESIVSDSSAVDNSPYKVNNVPGFDIGMLNDVLGGDKDISVVPGGSYDGSAAVEIRGGDSAERYFQQLDTDAVKFVLGDTAVKATGYFKVTAGNTEPKIWLGFGKSYGGGNSVGLHFANYLENGKADSGESFTARDDGWYYFEKTVDTGTFNNKINSMTELVWVKYMCGIDARTNTGAARFDNITCEIISSAEPGDANNDGEINILDMVRMKKYSAGNESFENITRGMWLTENTDGAAALAALKKVIIGASSEYGK